MSRITVLIVSWNSAEWIAAAIDSIPPGVPVLVWDNDSTDDTVARIAGLRRPRLEMMSSTSNIGFGPAMNRLASWASTEYIFLMNPDCQIVGGCLDVLAGSLDAHPGDAASVPLLIGNDEKPQREFQLRRLPTPSSMISDLLLLDEIRPASARLRRHWYAELDLERDEVIEQPAAAAMMLRREEFLAMSGFDEQFLPAWFEDVDLCRRLAARGRTLRLVPSARALHAGGSSLAALGYASFLEATHRNMSRYASKWFDDADVERVRWAAIAGAYARALAALTVRRPETVPALDAARGFARVAHGWFMRWDSSI